MCTAECTPLHPRNGPPSVGAPQATLEGSSAGHGAQRSFPMPLHTHTAAHAAAQRAVENGPFGVSCAVTAADAERSSLCHIIVVCVRACFCVCVCCVCVCVC